jgi:sugar phosphate isomerase/epimerase
MKWAFMTANFVAEEVFRIAKVIGAPVLASGFHPSNRPMLAELCQLHDIKFGYENHPEKSMGEVMRLIGEYARWIGSTLDTGWFATHGVDPVKAVDELRPHLVHVHLKDILAAGSHDSCAVGDGIVDAAGMLSALPRAGYQGSITLEHEPYDGDPMPAMTRSLAFVRSEWDKLLASQS